MALHQEIIAPPIVVFAEQHFDGQSRPVPDSSALEHEILNARILNATLNRLQPNQTLVIDADYNLLGGIVAHNLTNVTVRLDGQLIFSHRTRHWPRSAEADENGRTVYECLHFIDATNVTLTSSRRSPRGGTLDGQGSSWWGLPLFGYVRYNEDRPRLLRVTKGTNIVLENWLLLNSPYWSTLFEEMNGLVVRYVGVMARRTNSDGHSLLDLTAFNTDGLDITGRNVHVHDTNIWVQDDAIAVKDGPIIGAEDDDVDDADITDANRGMMRKSSDMLFERVNASGLGLTIGSIGNYSIVRNISFVDCYLRRPVKGIYSKFRKSNSTLIEDIRFENITMDAPQQFAVWIGPAQQADSVNICHANPCSLCWPFVPGAECSGEVKGTYRDILFKNIQINKPQNGGGVIMASAENPMLNIVFDGVKVGCGPLYHEGNIADAFPLLPSDKIFDVHVIIFLLVCFFAILIAGRACWMISRMAWSQTRYQQRATFALGLLGIPISLAAGHTAYISLAMGKVENYFVCEGVRGKAIGDTFPVPSCLDDHTNSVDGYSRVESSCPALHFWQEPLGGAMISALFTFAVCILPLLTGHLHLRQHQPHQRYDPIDGEVENLYASGNLACGDNTEDWTENESDTGVAMIGLRGRERQVDTE